jgi:poly-beta-1,6-N-acetyl-D-glucosamine synthase
MEIILYSLFVFYTAWMVWFIIGMKQIKTTIQKPETSYFEDFSIIIPFRNEEINLPALLHSISQLDYPTEHFKIYWVNDDSSDDSVQVIETILKHHPQISYEILNNHRESISPKKDAINWAMQHLKTQWIITTDADCILPKDWLQLFNQTIQETHAEMIVGSVLITESNQLLNQFQYFDLLSLQGVTLGSFGQKNGFLCNGANLAYTKELFRQINGFTNNQNIASGDDVFLLQEAQKQHKNIEYLLSPNHLVFTQAESTWKQLFHQRVRWAAKTTQYTLPLSKIIALVVFITNLATILLPVLALNDGIDSEKAVRFFILKILVDAVILTVTAQKLNQKIKWGTYLINSILYPLFSCAVALYSWTGKYQWKGRTFAQ